MTCCIFSESADEQKPGAASSSSRGDGNVEADKKVEDAADKEKTLVSSRDKDAGQKLGAAQTRKTDSEQNIEAKRQEILDAAADIAAKKKDTGTAAGDGAVRRETDEDAAQTAGADDDEQQKGDGDEKPADEDKEPKEGDGAGAHDEEQPKADGDEKQTDEDKEQKDGDGDGAGDRKTAEDDEDDENGDDRPAAADDNADKRDENDANDSKADQVQPSAPDAKQEPARTSGKDAYDADRINYDDNGESDKNAILDKVPRSGSAAYEVVDNLYDDDRKAGVQGREPSNRWAEDDDEDGHYVADDDDASYGTDAAAKDAGMDIKFAEHDAYEPAKDAQGSDTLRSTLFSFRHVLCMFCISCMLFSVPCSRLAGVASHSSRNCPLHELYKIIFESLDVLSVNYLHHRGNVLAVVCLSVCEQHN